MTKTIKPTAIFLLGPTAAGKTQICLELSKELPIEVISVDSALVYRHMNIGTAKPIGEELTNCPHHLVDIIDPNEHYSAAKFKNDAERLIEEIILRGAIPLLAGGTMMYYKAFKEGLNKLPERNTQIRNEIEIDARKNGWQYIHKKLREIDPETANRLSPNDSQRIQRAMEVFQVTGQPMSKLILKESPNKTDIETLDIALIPENRAILHDSIARRFIGMIEQGLVDEVINLKKNWNLTLEMPSMRCVGYRQTWEFLENKYDEASLIEKGCAATRQLAKRQLTWLRSLTIKHVFDPYANNTLSEIKELTKKFVR